MKVKGSFTVEAAVIVPLFLFVFGILLHTLFYYHDKNILKAVAHETIALASKEEDIKGTEMKEYFQSRIQGKLLLFSKVDSEIKSSKTEATVVCKAKKNVMSVKVECVMKRTKPEKYIRNIRKLKKIGEGIEKEE